MNCGFRIADFGFVDSLRSIYYYNEQYSLNPKSKFTLDLSTNSL